MTDFEKAVDYVIRNEGGYVDHPNDKAGETRYGITKFSYKNFFGRDPEDGEIKTLPLDTAKEIYKKDYWGKNGCDGMKHQSVATAIFDASVVFGSGTAVMAVQEVLKEYGFSRLQADGIVGPKTLEAINLADPTQLIYGLKKVLTERVLKIIKSNPSLLVFKRGWFARLNRMTTLV